MTMPLKSECPAATGQNAEYLNINKHNFCTGVPKSKAISAIRAQLALHDIELTVMACRDFLVHTYGKNHYCGDLKTLRAFAKRLGMSK